MAKVKIGDFLHRIKRPITLKPEVQYKLVTIKMHHKGVVMRGTKRGADIKSKMYQVKEGDFILSGIDARNGAFGIIPKELDSAIVTNDFWYFELNENIIDKYFFLELTSTSWFDEICRLGSDGTTQRIRLQKDKFFNQEIDLPSLDEQREFIVKFVRTKAINADLDNEIQSQQILLKKLRQSILQEAIEGKLTKAWREAHPDVEPASLLLKKIKAEKEQLVKEKKIRKQKPLPPISDEEKPFEIPEGWEWCRLGTIFFTTSGGTPTRSNPTYWNGNISWLKSGEMTDGLIADESEEKITEEGLEKSSATLFPENTLLIAMYGATAGKLGILKFPSTTNQAICGFYENTYVLQMYLFYYMRAMRDKIIEDSWGQSQPNISQTYLKELAFPLAPLEEQKKIVKKIEALFKICDELEEQISHTKADSEMLMQAVLREAFEEHA